MTTFNNRVSNHPNRRKLSIIENAGLPNERVTSEQVVDIERCDNLEDIVNNQVGTRLDAEALGRINDFVPFTTARSNDPGGGFLVTTNIVNVHTNSIRFKASVARMIGNNFAEISGTIYNNNGTLQAQTCHATVTGFGNMQQPTLGIHNGFVALWFNFETNWIDFQIEVNVSTWNGQRVNCVTDVQVMNEQPFSTLRTFTPRRVTLV